MAVIFIAFFFRTAAACSFVVTTAPATPTTCWGSCDGSVLIMISGSTAPYTVVYPGGSLITTGPAFVPGLCIGANTVTITDNTGCTATQVITITSPAELVVSGSVTPGAGCSSTITASSTGGTGTVMYSLDGGPAQSSPVFSGLCAGTYTLCATDANGCQDCETIVVSAASCTMVTTYTLVSPVSCYGSCDGSVLLVTSGGSPAYSFVHPVTGVTLVYTSGITLSGLCAGTWTLLITDVAGCSNVQVINVPGPPEIEINATATDESSPGACDGSISTATTGGSSPYTWSYDGGVSYTPADDVSGLCAGTYPVCVIDANGCEKCEDVTIDPGMACTLVSTFIPAPVSCYGSCNGSVTLVTSGGTPPYMVTYAGSPGTITYTGTTSIAGLCAGTYVFNITDVAGCMNVVTAVVTGPTPLVSTISVGSMPSGTTTCDGVINGTVSGGTPGYSYTWLQCTPMGPTGVVGAPPAGGFCYGTYAFLVADANGCTDTSACITLSPATGFEENTVHTLEVYPNPTSGSLTIGAAQNEVYNLLLTDMTGRNMATVDCRGEKTIDLAAYGLQDGIYLVFVLQQGRVTQGHKIILVR